MPGHQLESTAKNISAGTNSVRMMNVSTTEAQTRTNPNSLSTYVSDKRSDENAIAIMTPAAVIVVDCVPMAFKIEASVVYPS